MGRPSSYEKVYEDGRQTDSLTNCLKSVVPRNLRRGIPFAPSARKGDSLRFSDRRLPSSTFSNSFIHHSIATEYQARLIPLALVNNIDRTFAAEIAIQVLHKELKNLTRSML